MGRIQKKVIVEQRNNGIRTATLVESAMVHGWKNYKHDYHT